MMVTFSEEQKKYVEAHVPIEFYRPVRDYYGRETDKYYITDQCHLYRQKDLDDCDYLEEISDKSLEVKYKNGRVYGYVNKDGNIMSNQSLCKVLLRSFDDDPTHDKEFFDSHQVNHINPIRPLDNSLSNLEWTTHEENMYKAGETGVMIKKYQKSLIHQICQMICEGKSRMEIRQTLGVNGQLVDDIRAGRSHKSVTCQYLDKGFEYKINDREEKRERAREICKLIKAGRGTNDIVKILNLPNVCVVNDIKAKRAYKYISDEFF